MGVGGDTHGTVSILWEGASVASHLLGDGGVPCWRGKAAATALGEPEVESLDLIIKTQLFLPGSCQAKLHLWQEVCSLKAGGLGGLEPCQADLIFLGEGDWAMGPETMAGARILSFRF